MTRRIAGQAGMGHLELAAEILDLGQLRPEDDVYQAMANHGYARVVEDDGKLYIDFPRDLNKAQLATIEDLKFGKNLTVVKNGHEVRESRSSRSTARQLLHDLVTQQNQ